MINTTIQYDNIIIIIIVASAPASTRPDPRDRGQDPRGRGQDPRGRGRGQDPRGQDRGQDRGQGRVLTILAFGIIKMLKAIKTNFRKI